MGVELKPCPRCGSVDLSPPVDGAEWVDCLDCCLCGPSDDPEGSDWNELPRRTPGTIEVPESEVEAMRDAWIAYNKSPNKESDLWLAKELAAHAVIARLPKREPESAPCPWCRCASPEERCISTTPHGSFSVSCSCGASGPHRETREEAIVAWNRVSKMGSKP